MIIFAAVEQKTWEVAQRLKGKSFWRCVNTHRFFVFRVFSRFKAFLSLGGIIYHFQIKNALNAKFHKNNFAATDNAVLFLQP